MVKTAQHGRVRDRDRQTTPGVLGLSSLLAVAKRLAVAKSFYSRRDALWAYLLTATASANLRAQRSTPPSLETM